MSQEIMDTSGLLQSAGKSMGDKPWLKDLAKAVEGGLAKFQEAQTEMRAIMVKREMEPMTKASKHFEQVLKMCKGGSNKDLVRFLS